MRLLKQRERARLSVSSGTISLSVSDLPRFPPGHKPITNPQHLQKSPAPVQKTNAKTVKPEKGRKLSHEKNPAISHMPKASNQPVPTSTSA